MGGSRYRLLSVHVNIDQRASLLEKDEFLLEYG